MCFSIIILPLLSFCLLSIFGKIFNKRFLFSVSIFLISLAFIESLILFFFSSQGFIYKVDLFDWIHSFSVQIKWSFLFDGLTCTMLFVVLGVSTIVHIYSIGYMESDPGLVRFISYLSLFTFFMLILITGNNFFQLFFGWEGVGICSYLLISFWFTRLEALKSALKAVMVNKIGDFFLFLGLMLIYFFSNSLNYGVFFSLLPYLKYNLIHIFNGSYHLLTVFSIFLFIGAVGKSAQIGLHTWLPDAMEGPTPVSALIHAATMVTAGVFLLIRGSFLFEMSPFILKLFIIFGGLTALFGASVALVQLDIKKIIAYSTCSQLGYMVLACGFSGYNVALYHLFNHAFFKALLFLSAGIVIHAFFDEQDLRKLSISNKFIFSKVYLYFFLIGSLAITGFPGFSGYFSKDKILELAYSNFSYFGYFGFFAGTLTVFLTSFYSFKLLYLVGFSNDFNFNKNFKLKKVSMHDSNFLIYPLYLLVIGSIFSGYFFEDMLIGSGSPFLLKELFDIRLNLLLINLEYIPLFVKVFPTIFGFLGILLSYLCSHFFWKNIIYLLYLSDNFSKITVFLLKKWYFDKIYNKFILLYFINYSYKHSLKIIEKGFLEYLGYRLIIKLSLSSSNFFLKIFNSGYIFVYSFIYLQLVNLILLFSYFLFSFDIFYYNFLFQIY